MTRDIHRYEGGKLTIREDEFAVEAPLLIQLHGTRDSAKKAVAVTMRTPGDDVHLALGFLFSEGVIRDKGAVAGARLVGKEQSTVVVELAPGEMVDWQRLERHSYTSSSCGVCGKTSLEQVHQALPYPEPLTTWGVTPGVILQAPATLRRSQENFATTGGIHAAGLLSRAGALLTHAEDVGRHNALDKVIGRALLEDRLPLNDHLLVLSGRASFELIQKAAMAGIQFVIAVGAPSSLAIELAEDVGMTLCGFTRAERFNCYTGVDRID